MGRPPKPVEVKRRNGNPGRRPLPVPAVTVPAVVEVPPAARGLRAPGKRLWVDVWSMGRSWLMAYDGVLVEHACRLWDEIDQHRADIARHGSLLVEPILYKGDPTEHMRLVANPALRSLRDAEKSWQGVLSELGFSPTARARLGAVQVEVQGKLEQFFNAS